MKTIKGKITKIGNSLGVRIPSNYLKEMNLEHDDDVFISYDNRLNCIILSKNENTPNEIFERDVIEIIEKYLNQKLDED